MPSFKKHVCFYSQCRIFTTLVSYAKYAGNPQRGDGGSGSSLDEKPRSHDGSPAHTRGKGDPDKKTDYQISQLVPPHTLKRNRISFFICTSILTFVLSEKLKKNICKNSQAALKLHDRVVAMRTTRSDSSSSRADTNPPPPEANEVAQPQPTKQVHLSRYYTRYHLERYYMIVVAQSLRPGFF